MEWIHDLSGIQYLYDHSEVFRNMSQMRENVFTVADGSTFTRFGASLNSVQRTTVMADSEDRMILDIQYELEQGRMAVYLVNPSGQIVFQGDLIKNFESTQSFTGKKGLWSVITVSEETDSSINGSASIILRLDKDSEQRSQVPSYTDVRALGSMTLTSADKVHGDINWDSSGSVMILAVPGDYTEKEIISFLFGTNEEGTSIGASLKGKTILFSQSSKPPLKWDGNVNADDVYYFYLVSSGGITRLTGDLEIIKTDGSLKSLWKGTADI